MSGKTGAGRRYGQDGKRAARYQGNGAPDADMGKTASARPNIKVMGNTAGKRPACGQISGKWGAGRRYGQEDSKRAAKYQENGQHGGQAAGMWPNIRKMWRRAPLWARQQARGQISREWSNQCHGQAS
jgi:hypothetical protein